MTPDPLLSGEGSGEGLRLPDSAHSCAPRPRALARGNERFQFSCGVGATSAYLPPYSPDLNAIKPGFPKAGHAAPGDGPPSAFADMCEWTMERKRRAAPTQAPPGVTD